MVDLDKMFARAKSDVTNTKYTKSEQSKMFAAKSIGELEGTLNILKEMGTIDQDEYAKRYEKMAKLWDKI